MVEPSGIEPLTSCVQSRRSPSWAMAPFLKTEDWRRMTDNRITSWWFIFNFTTSIFMLDNKIKIIRAAYCTQIPSSAICLPFSELVGLSRLELPTSPLSGVRSNQLSYRPGSEDGKLRTENSSRITSWWFIFNFTINTFMPNNKIKKQSVQLAALKYRLLPSVFRPRD